MTKLRLFQLTASTFLGLIVVPVMWAGPINGTITGSTVTQVFGDDTNTATTINISFFSTCYFIDNGITAASPAFDSYNFVYAGQGAAAGISPIAPSDFSI